MIPDFLKHWSVRLTLIACMMSVSLLPSASAADARGYGVFKSIDFIQTSTNAPVLLSGAAYSFAAIVQPTGLLSNPIVRATVESPLGFVDELMAPPTNTDQPFALGWGAASQAELDSYYPTGTYTLRLTTAHDGNRVLRVPMMTNNFPSQAPRVVNYLSAQAIDSTAGFTVSWDPFIGGGTNDFISLSLVDSNNLVVFRSATFGEEPGLQLLNGTNTFLTIPPNTLSAGQPYFGYLYFERNALNQTTNYPGAKGFVGFSKATSFALRTSSLAFRLESLGLSGRQFSLQWQGDPGRTYVLQSLTNLGSTNWTPVITNVATGGLFTYTNVMTTNIGAHLFRLLLQP